MTLGKTVELFTRAFLCKLRLSMDISYGVYLYGFLVQQLVYMLFSDLGFAFNLFLSVALAGVFGLLSYKYIEEPIMRRSRDDSNFLKRLAVGYSKKWFDENKLR